MRTGAETAANRPRLGERLGLGRPAGVGLILAVVAVALAAPLWLWNDPLDGYSLRLEGLVGLGERLAGLADPFARARLQLDDFDYVSESRTGADLARHLLTPHNTHVVPLFRLWTYAWVRAAGSLERLPEALGLASYLTYVLALVLVAHVVAYETHRPAFGLGVMAAVGVSALLEPTVRWFSAGQAVASASAVLATLAALQQWRARGAWWWLVGGALAAAVAPLLWSGGYVAGPAGFVYLWADGRPRARRAAVVPLAASAIVAVGAFAVAGRTITASGNFHERTISEAANPFQGAISTSQGVIEILGLRNLGLEAVTTPLQAVVLCLGLACAWAWSRGRPWRPNPLEAAGAVLVLLGFFLVYTARGYFTFDSLRDLSWYQAIPQFGTALVAAGWIKGRHVPGELPMRLPVRPTRGGMLGVLGIVLLALMLQTTRVRARVVATAPPLTASEASRFPTPGLKRLRARYLDAEQVAWQRRFLGRLDRVEQAARRASIGRDALRTSLGRVLGPGMPSYVPHIDGLNLLALPELDAEADIERVRAAILPLLAPEPEPRPPWLRPDEPWPPGPRS